MGSIGGKYCALLEKFITTKIWEELSTLKLSIYSFSNDEVIFHSSEESVKKDIEDIKELLQVFKFPLLLMIRASFHLFFTSFG